MKEPDITIIRKVALKHLPDALDTEAKFFAEGAFNKLYLIRAIHSRQDFLMRIALPVDLCFKTESEAATLEYVRRHTTIPVPKVIAYHSSSQN